jgi:hypothetical protein
MKTLANILIIILLLTIISFIIYLGFGGTLGLGADNKDGIEEFKDNLGLIIDHLSK